MSNTNLPPNIPPGDDKPNDDDESPEKQPTPNPLSVEQRVLASAAEQEARMHDTLENLRNRVSGVEDDMQVLAPRVEMIAANQRIYRQPQQTIYVAQQPIPGASGAVASNFWMEWVLPFLISLIYIGLLIWLSYYLERRGPGDNPFELKATSLSQDPHPQETSQGGSSK